MMRMTFFPSTNAGPLLFSFWDVKNDKVFAITIVIIFLLAVAMEALRKIQVRLRDVQQVYRLVDDGMREADAACWRDDPDAAQVSADHVTSSTEASTPTHERSSPDRPQLSLEDSIQPPTLQMRLCRHFLNTLITILQYTLGYFLMLIVMSYDTWYLITILIGCAVGYYFFTIAIPTQVTNRRKAPKKGTNDVIGA